MTDRTRIAFSVLAGALLGGLAGFLLYTDRGRRLRADLQPHLDELSRELSHLQEMALNVKSTANDSWRRIEAFVDQLADRGTPQPGSSRQH